MSKVVNLMMLAKYEYSKELASHYRKGLIHCYIIYSFFLCTMIIVKGTMSGLSTKLL